MFKYALSQGRRDRVCFVPRSKRFPFRWDTSAPLFSSTIDIAPDPSSYDIRQVSLNSPIGINSSEGKCRDNKTFSWLIKEERRTRTARSAYGKGLVGGLT
jgi:hypothetical protein